MGGMAEAGKKLLPVTITVRPAPGVSRLTLSSTARVLMVNVPALGATQLYVQVSSPTARCHVVPPSVETSTAAMTPPTSEAVPLMVTALPTFRAVPLFGAVMDDTGFVASVDWVVDTSPA